ncbi:MAG: hypothetical protein JF596_18110, partial [Stenotrophomonas sp.]|nr:hypothetical protein [Stenotrophomonas sp.]
MSSIIYEGLGPPPPPPPTVGDGQIVLAGLGFARGFESGAIGDGVLALQPGPGGRLPPPITVCSGDGRIPLAAGFSFAIGVASPAHGDAEMALRGSGSWSSTVGDGVIRVVGSGSELATPPTDGDDIVRLTARMGGSLIQRSRETAALRTGVLLSPVMRGSWIGTRRLQSVVTFEEALAVVYHDLVQLALSADDGFALTSTAVEQMIDALLLSGAVVTELDAVTLVTEAITFGALLDGHAVNTLLVGLAASDTVATVYT